MGRRRHSYRRRRGGFGILYKLLSVILICGALFAAMIVFFRVDAVEVSGELHYTREQIAVASGIQKEDNLFLINKFQIAEKLMAELPYIEEVRMQRKLPDRFAIAVTECALPVAIRDGDVYYLMSPLGKLVEQIPLYRAQSYCIVEGCTLAGPRVGSKAALGEENEWQKEDLLKLLQALEEAGVLEEVSAIRLEGQDGIAMDCMNRFTVELLWGADYAYKLQVFQAILDSGKIQENMTGTFDMRREDGRTHFIQNKH